MYKNKGYPCRLKREDLTGGSTEDKKLTISWDDVRLVLDDWKRIMVNCKRIAAETFLYYFSEHPSYRNVFPSFASVSDDLLPQNEDFQIHCLAVFRGIDSLMRNLSGEYEEENEVLPAIGVTHLKRGVTLVMMEHLKQSLLYICCDFLESNRQEKASWKVVLDYAFDEYLCRAHPRPEEEDEDEGW